MNIWSVLEAVFCLLRWFMTESFVKLVYFFIRGCWQSIKLFQKRIIFSFQLYDVLLKYFLVALMMHYLGFELGDPRVQGIRKKFIALL